MSCVIDTLNTLKALTNTNKFNGLALIVMAEKAWYVCDIAARDAADNKNIILPNDGIGRWFKCNNTSNVLNTTYTYTTTSSPLVVDFTNYEQINILFTQNCTINFQSLLRNGYGYLILNRINTTWLISGWDSRMRWSSTSYNFSNNINVAILHLVFFNNLIYVTKIAEYV